MSTSGADRPRAGRRHRRLRAADHLLARLLHRRPAALLRDRDGHRRLDHARARQGPPRERQPARDVGPHLVRPHQGPPHQRQGAGPQPLPALDRDDVRRGGRAGVQVARRSELDSRVLRNLWNRGLLKDLLQSHLISWAQALALKIEVEDGKEKPPSSRASPAGACFEARAPDPVLPHLLPAHRRADPRRRSSLVVGRSSAPGARLRPHPRAPLARLVSRADGGRARGLSEQSTTLPHQPRVHGGAPVSRVRRLLASRPRRSAARSLARARRRPSRVGDVRGARDALWYCDDAESAPEDGLGDGPDDAAGLQGAGGRARRGADASASAVAAERAFATTCRGTTRRDPSAPFAPRACCSASSSVLVRGARAGRRPRALLRNRRTLSPPSTRSGSRQRVGAVASTTRRLQRIGSRRRSADALPRRWANREDGEGRVGANTALRAASSLAPLREATP